jgi:hypothetical protein
MPYKSISRYILYSVSSYILNVCRIKVAKNIEIEIVYKDRYFNFPDEVYKITTTPNEIKRELIGDEISWINYNNDDNDDNDTFLVLKNGVIVEEPENPEVN